MVNKILDTYLRTLQKQAFYKAASMVYTPGYGLQDIINKPTQKVEAPAPQPAPQPVPQPQDSNVVPPPTAPVQNQQPAAQKRVMPQSKATPPTPNVDIAVPNYNVGTALNLPEAIDVGSDLPEPLPDNSLGIPGDTFENIPSDPAAAQSNSTQPMPNVDIAVPDYNVGAALNLPESLDLGGDLPEPLPDNSLGVPEDVFENMPPDPAEAQRRPMLQSNVAPPTPNVNIAMPDYNVGTALNLPEAIDIGGDLPEPLPDNSLGVPADAFKNTALDNPEVRKALAEQEQIRKQYEANAPKVERKRKANRNYTQRVMDAEKKRHLEGVARTNIDAATGKYIGQQEAAGNVLPAPTPKPNPQVGSNAYSDPEAAYKMFLRRGNTPEHARAAADAIRTYNQQIGLGADHNTAMDIVNSSFSPDLPIEYEAQLIDHLNRQYRMNQNRQYINPQYSEEQALEDSRRQAAMDNNRFLNPSDFTNKDRLREASTYVSHGGQVVNPRTGRINSKATTRKQRASNRRRADAAANAAGLRWSPTRGTYVYG